MLYCPECGSKDWADRYAEELRRAEGEPLACWDCLCRTGKRVAVVTKKVNRAS